jgi:hypothetical protein
VVSVGVAVRTGGSVKVTIVVVKQPVAPETVTVYTPAGKSSLKAVVLVIVVRV